MAGVIFIFVSSSDDCLNTVKPAHVFISTYLINITQLPTGKLVSVRHPVSIVATVTGKVVTIISCYINHFIRSVTTQMMTCIFYLYYYKMTLLEHYLSFYDSYVMTVDL